MLKFTAVSRDGRQVYFVGLARENVEKLTRDQPIKVNLAEMGGPDVDVVLLFKESSLDLFEDLKRAGMIPPSVEYREARPGEVDVWRLKEGGR